MNAALSIVDKWCTDNGLLVHPQKTKLVLFTNKIFWQCGYAFSKNRELKLKVIEWFYTSIIRSIACYEVHIWHNGVQIKKIRQVIEHVNGM